MSATDELTVMRRTVVDHVANGMCSRSPAVIVAAQSLASELALAGTPIDDDVDARLIELEAAAYIHRAQCPLQQNGEPK